jgi:DNA/RNA-binding domain of Phe-tRNA-synthetase-like protein
MALKISREVKERFPDLVVLTAHIDGVEVKEREKTLDPFEREVVEEVKARYNISTVKDISIFRAYRDFFWQMGIDPTKTRPAAEALIRRILQGKPLPRINNIVDAYNLASIRTHIALAAFDRDRLVGDLVLRMAEEGELFLGIGMEETIRLSGRETVVSDDEKIVAIYPYRDAENTKVTHGTRSILLLICGVPGIDVDTLRRAGGEALEVITRFCGGVGGLE